MHAASVVEFPMVSPAGATPEMFPLSGTGPDLALFGWAGVVDNANIVGHRAVAVPGVVAGLALALEQFGTISLAAALAPAIDLAESGWVVTWSATKFITRDMVNLGKIPGHRPDLPRFPGQSAVHAGRRPSHVSASARPRPNAANHRGPGTTSALRGRDRPTDRE